MKDSEEKNYKNEIDLHEIIEVVWKKKIFIFSFSIFFASLTILISFLYLPNIYKSEALLLPADDSQSGMNAISQYSSLASIAGISIPSQDVDKSLEAIERIKSFEFFSNYFLSTIRLEDLMAVKSWDPDLNEILYDNKTFDTSSNKWIRKVSYPKKTIPSAQEAYKRYKKIMSVSQNTKSKFIYISIEHQSPHIAKAWVDNVIELINKSMRDADKIKTLKSIEFLNEQSAKSNYENLKNAFNTLQQEQMKSLMLIEANEDYIFKIVNSPIVPELKSGPQRFLLTVVGFLIGFILSIAFVLVSNFTKKR